MTHPNPSDHPERAARAFVGHTKTPWRHVAYEGGWDGVASSDGDLRVLVCKLVENNPANAAFIVQAVNAHDDLLAALKAIKQFGELGCVDVSGRGYTGGKKPATKDVWQFPRHMLVEIDAAILKAESKS